MTFSFSAAHDAAYASGWPHVRRLDAATDLDAVDAARAQLRDVDPPWLPDRTEAMCLAYVRGFDVTPRADPREAEARMASTAPLDGGEVDDLLDRWLRSSRYWFQIEELVLSLEALLGSDAAGIRIAARLARKRRTAGPELGSFFGNALTDAPQAALFCLGFVALRSPPTRAALEDLRPGSTGTTRQVLELVLDGADACRRHGVRHLFAASFAGDDPAYLASLSATERFHASLTPRFPYLGGEPVLAHYLERVRKGIPRERALRFVAEFGTIRHPLVVEMMELLATRPTPAAAARAWLHDHRALVAG